MFPKTAVVGCTGAGARVIRTILGFTELYSVLGTAGAAEGNISCG